jgi:hypothetical protein
MAGQIPNSDRDFLITAFRERIMEKQGVVPLVHQRKWFSATDGLILLEGESDPQGVSVQLSDGTRDKWAVLPREHGRAKVVADLGAFKTGKSFGTGLWCSGFAAIPGAKVTLIGVEYSMVEPEFAYIMENLLSARGMGMKAVKKSANVRTGDFFLELENGMQFDAKSWERKDALKGKEVDAYVFCEAYQFPGIEAFTDIRQNLVARDGYAIFPTTPDRPWIKELHNRGHGDKEGTATRSIRSGNASAMCRGVRTRIPTMRGSRNKTGRSSRGRSSRSPIMARSAISSAGCSSIREETSRSMSEVIQSSFHQGEGAGTISFSLQATNLSAAQIQGLTTLLSWLRSHPLVRPLSSTSSLTIDTSAGLLSDERTSLSPSGLTRSERAFID